MKKTYLNTIMSHYFDLQDLNDEKWLEDENGFYTMNQEEVVWFEQLSEAYDNLSQEELETIPFNDYDEIIDYYNGKKVDKWTAPFLSF